MAAIDDLLDSQIIAELTAKLGASSGSKRKINIPFAALALGAEMDFTLESDISDLMVQLANAKGWTVKVYFSDQHVEFSDD